MTKAKARGTTPSLIGSSNGRPTRSTAKKLCSCSRCHENLVAGTPCVDIPKVGGAFVSSRRVCNDCFEKIIQKTQEDLDALKQI